MRGARDGKAFSSYFLPSSTDFLQSHVQERVPSTRQGCYPHLDKVADDIQHNIRTRRLQALDSFLGWKSVQLAPWLSKKGHGLSTPVSCIFKTSYRKRDKSGAPGEADANAGSAEMGSKLQLAR